MLNKIVFYYFLFLVFTPVISNSQNCNNWLQLTSQPSFVSIGDLDITGNKLTVEATFNRTSQWSGSDVFQGDLVSKHEDQSDCNYLLRPSSAEITTTNGYFKTPVICPIILNKTYHAAMVYDGITLKFYRNGYLMSQIAASGNLIQNNWKTQIGLYFNQVTQENFIGYINEVRIWNVARTQNEIKSYINQSLPNPQSLPGLLAYYTFDNLVNKQGNTLWNGNLNGNAFINKVNSQCTFIADSCNVVPPTLTTSCSAFQMALGGTQNDRAFDVAPAFNDEIFVAGTSASFGNGEEIVISRLKNNGSVIWSKTFGSTKTESVRKITPTADGGLLVVGQTNSYNNYGDILCMKIDDAGNLLWSRKFGLGSQLGDLGMDVIETTDGGYAISGIINVNGKFADNVVIKLNSSANISWTKRFDRGDGEDGVGIIQNGDTLVVASDLMNNGSHYEFQVMKLNLSDGAFIMSKKFKPSSRGLFNPYIYKNPLRPGYIISGHTIEYDTYNYMRHTILILDENLELIQTKLISLPSQTNDFFTGFAAMPDGSFIGCATSQSSPDGYFYRINADNTISYSKKFNSSEARRLYRLIVSNDKVFAVGGAVQNGQEDFFITSFNVDGNMPAHCEVENVNLVVEHPSYSVNSFTWPSIVDVNFINTIISLGNNFVNLQKTALCQNTASIDFTFSPDICDLKKINFTSTASGILSYEWDFGNGQKNTSNLNPSVTYDEYDTYNVKLKVVYTGGCIDSIIKPVPVLYDLSNNIVNNDTAICLGQSVVLTTTGDYLNFCWQSNNGYNNSTTPVITVTPQSTTTYTFTTQTKEQNLVVNGNFSAGNTGFTSQYNLSNSGLPAGVYSIGADVLAWHPGMVACGDHTTSSGNMMMVNGANQQNVEVWKQTIVVQPNTNYAFSTWLQNISTLNPAQLRFSINSVQLGNIFNANNQSCIWDQFYIVWNSGTNTSATIAIVNMNQGFSGNDFALDDIFFGKISNKIDSVKITVSSPLPHSPTKNYNICKGNIKIGSAIPSATYLWSTGETTDSITVSTSGIYWVESKSNGCMVRDSFQLLVAQGGDTDFGFKQNLCNPRIVEFSTTLLGAQSYQWDFGNNQTNSSSFNPTITYNTFGSYDVTLTVQYSAACIDRVTKKVVVDAPFDNTIIFNSDTSICKGDSILLSTKPVSNYCWTTSNGNPPLLINKYVSPDVTTTYAIKAQIEGANLVTNSNFNDGNTGFTSDYNYAISNVTEAQYWVGSSPSLWNTAMSNCNDHTPGSGGMLCVNGAPTPNAKVWSQTVTVTPNTTYNFSVWIASLYPPNPANLKFSINNVIIGNNIIASNPCEWNQFYSSWNSGSNTTATITIVNNNTVVQGNDFALDDIFFGTVSTKTDSFKVNVNVRPTILLNNDTTICQDASIQLNANVSGANTITWTPVSDLSNAGIENPIAKPLKTTLYKVHAMSNNGCSNSDSILITVTPKPVFKLDPLNKTICLGESVTLNASGGDVYSWDKSNSTQNSIIVTPTTDLDYTVYIKQNECDFKDTLKASIKVNPLPAITINKSNDIDCSNFQTQLSATGGIKYEWSPSLNLSNPYINNPTATPDQTTTYTVKVESPEGCKSTDSIKINVSATGDGRFLIPNAFTPNNDGKNDCFNLKHWGNLKDFTLNIYNRWGELVFTSNNNNQCWDGTYKGKPQPSGVFVYYVKTNTMCGDIFRKGIITLIR